TLIRAAGPAEFIPAEPPAEPACTPLLAATQVSRVSLVALPAENAKNPLFRLPATMLFHTVDTERSSDLNPNPLPSIRTLLSSANPVTPFGCTHTPPPLQFLTVVFLTKS